MTSPSWTVTARRVLASQLDRLRVFLEGVGRGLRDRLAGAIGEAVAAVLRALLEVGEEGYPVSPQHWYPPREPPSWRDEVEDAWRDEPEPYYPTQPAETPSEGSTSWRPKLAAALQLASWWLRRPVDGLPRRVAVAAGVATGLASLAGVPLSAAAALVGSAMGLMALADAARDGVHALMRAAAT
jgi:hypothetical protein